MSVAGPKRAGDLLLVEARLELAECLRQSARHDDLQWQGKIRRWLVAFLVGQGHKAVEFLNDRLSIEGC